MMSWMVTLNQYNTQSTISPEILEQCSSNLAPEMCITKGRELHLLSCCHGNTFGPSVFLLKTKYPHFQHFKVGQRVLPRILIVPILS